MGRPTKKGSPGMRLQLGASVLSAARAVDTRLVKDRLGRFDRVHRTYVTAQRKLDAAESKLRAAQEHLAELDAIQDEAVEALANALAGDGQPRVNPFDAFGTEAPGMLTRLAFADEARAVQQLTAAVRRSKNVSKATIQAAVAAEKAAGMVEKALTPIVKLQDDVRDARRARDAVGQGWESALAALRRGARAAADEGAPDLYPTLFPPVVRRATNKKETEPTVPQATKAA